VSVINLNRVAKFLKKHDFFNPRPSLWYFAVLVFIVDSILFEIPLHITYSTVVNLGFFLWGFTVFPGVMYAFFEFSKVPDTKDTFWALMVYLIVTCIIVISLQLGLRSFNNMAISVGVLLPFYSFIDAVLKLAGSVAFVSIGVGALVIRRKIPGSPFKVEEAEPAQPQGPRTPARYFAVTGLVMIGLSIYLGLFQPIAFEALIILLSGVVLFSAAFPIRWMVLRFRSGKETKPNN
jgi:hypothetical protein